MHKTKLSRAAAAAVAAAVLLLAAAPAVEADPTPGALRVADADTSSDYLISLGGQDSTLLDGRIWTDKSVSTTDVTFTGDAGSITVDNDSDFLVTYSALATSTQIVSETTAPVDVVFVLDFSASMAWGQYQNGRGTVTTQAESRVQAMVDGLNEAIGILAEANEQNRVGIVVFNRGAQTMLDLTTVTPRPAQDYLEITRWNATPGADDGNNGNVQVTCRINASTIPLDSYTNIHAGVYQGMQMLLNATDTQVEIDGQQVTRVPNLILMSDGAPTTFSRASSGGQWWQGIENTPIGSGDNNNPHSGNGFLPLITASYFKRAVTAHYYPNAQPGEQARVFTIGFKTAEQNQGMRTMADLVLDPGSYWTADNSYTDTGIAQVDAVNTAWQQYRAGTAPQVQYTPGSQEYTVEVAPAPYNPDSLIYPDATFTADNADALWNAFRQIINSITSSAKGPTQVEDNDPVHSGYILYQDPIGQYMQVNQVKSILWAGVEFRLDAGYTPTPESLPDGGVRYTYTGHFSNADGGKNFDSPVYGRGNVDDILVTVLQDSAGNQTLRVAVPASAIPIRVNTVTLDPSNLPVDNVSNGAYPLRVCYTVGLKPEVTNPDGTLNTNPDTGGVSAEYLAAHTDPDTRQVYFYTNLYTGRTENGDTVGNATVEFDPASTNPFYYIQEDTPLYTDPDCTVRADQATFDPNRYYYFQDAYYAGAGTSVTARTFVIRRQGANLQDYVARDGQGWYIVADSPRLGNLADLIRQKGQGNLTQTAQTSFYPTYQANGLPQGWLNAYQGNNGRLGLAAPASLTITKQVTADAGLTLPENGAFQFTLTAPAKANQTLTGSLSTGESAVAQPLQFDADGTTSFTLRAGESLTVPDLQNTAFTVEETSLPQGFVLDTVTADPADLGSRSGNAFSGTLGADPARLTFTNAYRAVFAPDAQAIRLPVSKSLTGYRDSWQPGESYTFQISPSSRADNNLNAALALPATTLTLTGEMPTGSFVVDLGRLLSQDTLQALRQAAGLLPSTAETSSTAETAARPQSPETARHSRPEGKVTLAGLTADQAAGLSRDQARALLEGIPGLYYYTITETGDPDQMQQQQVTKDLSRYEAVIQVTDNGAGLLTAQLLRFERVAGQTGAELTTPESVDQAAFVNRTAALPTPTPTATPQATATPAPTVTPQATALPEPSASPRPTPGGTLSPQATPTPTAGQTANPDTGDPLPLPALLLGGAAAGLGLACLLLVRRRQ